MNKKFLKVSEKFGNIEILESSCNISTVQDGRGGIFTWMLDEKIVEINLIYYNANKVRGNHFHPEFNEYWMLVEGAGIKVTKDPKSNKTLIRHIAEGTLIRVPKNTTHAFHAIRPAKAMSFLTKHWESCKDPIIHESIVEMDDEYKKYAKDKGFKHSIEEILKKKKK